MQKDNKFFDDIARMASSAGGTFLEMKREMEAMATGQFEKMLHKMDLVTREEFNVVKEMAAKARAEQEKLAKRLAELEGGATAKAAPAKPKPAAKAAAPKRKPAKKAGH